MSEQESFLPWRRQPFPIPWEEVFGPRPLHLEVGFGDGRYTARRAAEAPQDAFVGLEISSASLQRAQRRLRREGLTNVRLLKVGAQFAVRHLFAEDSLSEIVVNFPDPWPKAKHAKNRLLQRDFFALAASRLRPGGSVALATDHPDYLAFARDEAEASGLYRAEAAAAPAAVFETKYALKWRAQGKPLHYLRFVYQGGPTPHFPPLERPAVMPHALLTGSLPDARTLTFAKQVLPYGGGHVILHELALSLGGDAPPGERWLVRATVDEPDLHQQLLVVVQRRAGGELIVRLEPFGDPIVTAASRGAVHAVTEWLLGLGGGLRLLARNY